MSYEGYTELLCDVGHYDSFDVYQDQPKQCRCGAAWAWRHGVDVTNGYDEAEEYSSDAPKSAIGGDPVSHTDFLGNRYYTLSERFEPIGDAWCRFQRRPISECLSAFEVLAAQGTSASGQDAKRLEAKPAGPVSEGNAP